jgi:hypothetical protein
VDPFVFSLKHRFGEGRFFFCGARALPCLGLCLRCICGASAVASSTVHLIWVLSSAVLLICGASHLRCFSSPGMPLRCIRLSVFNLCGYICVGRASAVIRYCCALPRYFCEVFLVLYCGASAVLLRCCCVVLRCGGSAVQWFYSAVVHGAVHSVGEVCVYPIASWSIGGN